MPQPAILINRFFYGTESIGEKCVVTVCFFLWEDLVVPIIKKEPHRADVSLDDLSCQNPACTPNHSQFHLIFLQACLKTSQQLNV